MSPGLLKALLQSVNYFRNWRKGDPESATQCGRKYLLWILVVGSSGLWVLYQHDLAVPADFAMFTGGVFLIELFKFGTLLRLGMAIDPLVGGILGTIGLGTLDNYSEGLLYSRTLSHAAAIHPPIQRI